MKTQQLLTQEKSAYVKVEPPCPYFGTCGGCTLQDLAYADQLKLKRERIRRAFTGLDDASPIEIVGLDEPWRYRNKAEFTFGESGAHLVLGYHVARSFWRIVDLEDCLLLPQPAMRILCDVRSLAERTGLPAYHPKTHQGFFRYLLVRSSRATGQVLLCLVTSPGSRGVVEGLARELVQRHPTLASVYWGVSDRLADVAIPDELTLLQGDAYLEDRLGLFRLKLHPLSFLQPAHVQAQRIYEWLCHFARSAAYKVAWDLYCGVGLVAFHLAQAVRQVYGIDVEPHHLELARLNASWNGLRNIEFRVGRVEALLTDRRFWLQEAKPDLVVVDPPRAGLHPRALASLVAARPRSIVYLSCHVRSLVRDLQILRGSFPRYRVCHVQAFDMFPQTDHVEVLVLLQR